MKDIKIRTYYTTLLIKQLLKRAVFFLTGLLFFFGNTPILAQDLRDLDHTLQFANYLFKTQQYILAAEEYERAVYYDTTNTEALLKLFQSYRLAEKHEVVKIRFDYFFKDSVNNLNSSLSREYVFNLVFRKQFSATYDFLEKNNSIEISEKETYQLGSLLLQKDWDNSFNYALKHSVKDGKKNADMHVIAFNSKQLKYKSPFNAALFSTIIPGTGKMYTKNWKDGIISLIFVGVNSWQAYRGFHKYGNESVYGWVFAGFAASFYIGNIFGSYKSAKKYNKKLDDDIYHKAWNLMVTDM